MDKITRKKALSLKEGAKKYFQTVKMLFINSIQM